MIPKLSCCRGGDGCDEQYTAHTIGSQAKTLTSLWNAGEVITDCACSRHTYQLRIEWLASQPHISATNTNVAQPPVAIRRVTAHPSEQKQAGVQENVIQIVSLENLWRISACAPATWDPCCSAALPRRVIPVLSRDRVFQEHSATSVASGVSEHG